MYIASFYAQKLAPLLEDSFGQGQSLRALCPTPAPLWLSAWPPSILSYSKSALLSSNPALQGLTPAPPPSWLPSASLPSGLPSGLYHLLFRKWPWLTICPLSRQHPSLVSLHTAHPVPPRHQSCASGKFSSHSAGYIHVPYPHCLATQ